MRFAIKPERRWIAIAAFVALAFPGSFTSPNGALAKEEPEKYADRLIDAKTVFVELMQASDRQVPESLLRKAKCIVVIPDMVKGAIGFGARWGNGVMSCRGESGSWSPPVFVNLKGGSWGFQIGAEKTDLVLFFMTERGARSLVTSSKFTLGGKVSVAAGPLGRSGEAATDLKLNAEIYSYAKSKGLFAGLSLEGARLAPSKHGNEVYYGAPVSAADVLFHHRAPLMRTEAKEFIAVLPRG